MAKKPPKILHGYGSLPVNPQFPEQDFKLLVVKYINSPKLVVIREFISLNDKKYFTKKGIALTKEQFLYILEHQVDIMNVLEE